LLADDNRCEINVQWTNELMDNEWSMTQCVNDLLQN